MKKIISKIKNFSNNPQVISIFTILILVTGIIIVNSFYVPLYLTIISLLLIASLAFISIYGQVKALNTIKRNESSSAKLQKIIKNTKEGIIVYSEDFKIIEINPAAEKILEIEEDKVKNKKISPKLVQKSDLKLISQTIFPSMAPFAKRIKTEEWPHLIEIKTENPSKVLLTITSKIEQKGSKKFIKIIKDKTKQQEIKNSKKEFISTTAHQLRTPINGISWALENIKKSVDKESDIQETIKEGLDLSNRALKIINDLLTVTEIEGERVEKYEKEEFNINNVLKEVIKQTKTMASKYNIDLEFKPEKNMEVVADKNKIKAVVSTIIENAIVYNKEGGKVEVGTTKKEDKAKIKVSDNGIGIPEEEIDKIFKKFHRGSQAKKIQPNGSGLGLYMAKKIINEHGGRIWVNSKKGRGTTFNFTIPLSQSKNFKKAKNESNRN
ncbi:MAG: ATP-binding protein [Candidatus Magasanikbacteria bacterium]